MPNKPGKTAEEEKVIASLQRELKTCQNKVQKYEILIKELERQKDMFQTFLDTATDNIYFKDRQSRMTLICKKMKEWFKEKGINEFIGKTDFDFFTIEHAQQAYDDEQELMRTGIPMINKEEKETWEDGSETWASSSKIPIKNKRGKITGMVGISRDITDKKEAEAKLHRYKENLEKAKAETDNILAGVKEGLFLLNADLKIGSQHSKQLLNIFEEKKLAGKDFLSVLKHKITKETIDTTHNYLELLFDNKHDEEMLGDLNPLQEVAFKFGRKKKFLSFNFSRIKARGDKVKELMVTVVDVTKEISLQQSLDEQRNENKRKMDWILSIFNTDPVMLKEFISSVQDEMKVVENTFNTLSVEEKHLNLLDTIYRSLHTIKGNASLLELNFFADQAHRAEDTVSVIKSKMKLIKKDKTELKHQIKNIHKMFDEFRNLIAQLSNIHDKLRPTRRHEQTQLINSLIRLTDSLAIRYQKKIDLHLTDFDGAIIPYKHRLLLRDILVQLVRNSAYHGIEKPAQRKKRNKPDTGQITIASSKKNKHCKLEFKDDGKGLDLEAIKKSVAKSGKWSQSEINTWSQNQLVKAIFLPGVSTAQKSTITAGRGIGMDVIQSKIKNIGGKISVTSSPGRYTRFVIILPA
jgi:PAS domain S-box-containing protein